MLHLHVLYDFSGHGLFLGRGDQYFIFPLGVIETKECVCHLITYL